MPVDNLPLWIGAAIVVFIVIGYVWSARRNHSSDASARDFKEKLGEGVGDPLAETPQEPSFKSEAEKDAESDEASEVPSDEGLVFDDDEELSREPRFPGQPVQEELDFTASGSAVLLSQGRSAPDIDSGIEAVVNFVPREGNFDQDRIKALERRVNENRLRDLIRVDYQNAATGRWSHKAKAVVSCSQIYMTMLLANRGRVLDELTASGFLQLADHVAIEINADAALPDIQMMLDAARQIAEVITHYDNALSVKIAAPEDFDQSAVRMAATACGFTYRGDHYERCIAGTKVPAMQLWPSKQLPNEMELTLDIPMTSAAANPLGDFFAVGNDLCCRLGAVMADSVGQPVGSPIAALICRQLSEMYGQMAASGVPAGSQRARRIFTRI